MATISMTIEGPNVGTFVTTRSLSDTDAGRILAAYGAISGQVQDGEDEDGQPVMRNRTPEEIVDLLTDGTMKGILANVQRHEQEVAARAASEAVTPIEATVA